MQTELKRDRLVVILNNKESFIYGIFDVFLNPFSPASKRAIGEILYKASNGEVSNFIGSLKVDVTLNPDGGATLCFFKQTKKVKIPVNYKIYKFANSDDLLDYLKLKNFRLDQHQQLFFSGGKYIIKSEKENLLLAEFAEKVKRREYFSILKNAVRIKK